jgi:hypothetical protein
MKCCVAIVLVAMTASSAAAAEPVSIQCADADNRAARPYFVTFDFEAKRLVFQSNSTRPSSGEIRSASNDRIEFSINGDYGKIDLVWDLRTNKMVWAGLGEIRPLLAHPCVAAEPRTLLSVFDRTTNARAGARPFSLRCTGDSGTYFFTLDRETKKVVLEGLHGGGLYPGDIQSADEHRIEFLLTTGNTPRFDLAWDIRDGTVTWQGVPGDISRPTTINQCVEVEARSILTLYEYGRLK